MKCNFRRADRWPRQMAVRYSQIRFDDQPYAVHQDFSVSAGGFCCFTWDLQGQRRPASMEDVRQTRIC